MNILCKDKYVPLKEIGRGTFGIAVKAHCRRTGDAIVIKMIDCSKLTPRQEKDAINELNVLRSLKHPYVVSHLDNFSESGNLCIVMEYATGGDLYSRIRLKSLLRNSQFSEQQIVKWFGQMLQGVSYIHSLNIMHRDLKPQNLFLTADGENEKILIGDFGVCKVMRSNTDMTSTVTGTPYYLSPEVFQKKPYSMKSDVWSLGCILFELAALSVPFDAPDISALEAKVTRGPNPRFPPQFSRDLRDVFLSAIRRDHRTRPSAEQLLETPLLAFSIEHRPLGKIAVNRINSLSPRRSPPIVAESPKTVQRIRGSSPVVSIRSESPIPSQRIKGLPPVVSIRSESPAPRIRGSSPVVSIRSASPATAPRIRGSSPVPNQKIKARIITESSYNSHRLRAPSPIAQSRVGSYRSVERKIRRPSVSSPRMNGRNIAGLSPRLPSPIPRTKLPSPRHASKKLSVRLADSSSSSLSTRPPFRAGSPVRYF